MKALIIYLYEFDREFSMKCLHDLEQNGYRVHTYLLFRMTLKQLF